MTERTPIKMDVSISKSYNPYRFKDLVNVYRINDEIFDLGITYKKSPLGMEVKTYNLERTVCDIIKDIDIRTTMDMDTCIKGITLTDDELYQVLNEILSTDVGDNVKFEIKNSKPIREEDDYGGLRYNNVIKVIKNYI